MKTKDICKQALNERISSMEGLIKSAKQCLKDDDCLQCAVRLEKVAEHGRFDEIIMNVFDSVSAQ